MSDEKIPDPKAIREAEKEGFIFSEDKKTLLECRNKMIKEAVIPDGVTGIGYSTFFRCISLTGVTIPGSVTKIGLWAFQGCSSLNEINIPASVIQIDPEAFEGCSSLTNVIIPDGVTEIGWGTFQNCTALTCVNIPDGVTGIGDLAFSGCTSLTRINIPDSVTVIGKGAFAGTGCEEQVSRDYPACSGRRKPDFRGICSSYRPLPVFTGALQTFSGCAERGNDNRSRVFLSPPHPFAFPRGAPIMG